MEATANNPSLITVLKEFDEFYVDDYQRAYSWEKDQILDLFHDLSDSVLSQENHFFGTLILQDAGSKKCHIVDGQQRLTTVFLLFASLRDHVSKMSTKELAPKTSNGFSVNVEQKAWEILVHGNEKSDLRFRSSRFLRKILELSVFPEPAKQQAIKIKENQITLKLRRGIGFVRELVDNDLSNYHSEQEKLQRINDLLDSISNRFLVLRVVTRSLNESLEIFLTLNNRGMSLGPSDLVRGEVMTNLSFGEAQDKQQQIHRDVYDAWKDIVENVRDPEIFLRHYLVATGEDKVQKKKIIETVQKRVRSSAPEERKTKSALFWNDLSHASEFYNKILEPTGGNNHTHYLELLEGLSKSHRVFLLTAFRYTDGPDLDELIRLTWLLSARWITAGRNAQQLEDLYQELSLSMRKGGSSAELVEKLKKESDFDPSIKKHVSEEGYTSFIGRALLHSINRSIATTKGANVIELNKNIHMEHIAPNAMTEEWLASLFEGRDNMTEHYNSVVSSLGNLTLLDQRLNQKSKRKPFRVIDTKKGVEAGKVSHYQDSNMHIAKDLAKLSKWTEVEVQKREDWLVECYEKLWNADAEIEVEEFSVWLDRGK